MRASVEDVLALGRELLEPTVVARETLDELTAVQFPGLSGVLPDWGRFDPLDWGLGVQLATSPPTWMGKRVSRRAFGHFGGSGTFLWVDPELGIACAVSRTAFGDWAKEAWPDLSDAVVAELKAGDGHRRWQSAGGQPPSSAKIGRTSSSKAAASQLATTHGVIAVTVAVRGTPIASDLAEELARADDPALAERGLGHARDAGEEHVEPVTGSALADQHRARGDLVALHPVGELRERLAGERGEEPHARELGHAGRDVARAHEREPKAGVVGTAVRYPRGRPRRLATLPSLRVAARPFRGRVECPACGFEHWAHSSPAVSALVVDDRDGVLLGRRAAEPDAGLWDTLGGFLEEGEHPLDALGASSARRPGSTSSPARSSAPSSTPTARGTMPRQSSISSGRRPPGRGSRPRPTTSPSCAGSRATTCLPTPRSPSAGSLLSPRLGREGLKTHRRAGIPALRLGEGRGSLERNSWKSLLARILLATEAAQPDVSGGRFGGEAERALDRGLGWAPTTAEAGSPSLKRIIVGIDMTPYRSGRALLLVDVDLHELELAVSLLDDLVEHGRDGVARAAPLRPEVHEHRCVALQDLLLERRLCHVDCHLNLSILSTRYEALLGG